MDEKKGLKKIKIRGTRFLCPYKTKIIIIRRRIESIFESRI